MASEGRDLPSPRQRTTVVVRLECLVSQNDISPGPLNGLGRVRRSYDRRLVTLSKSTLRWKLVAVSDIQNRTELRGWKGADEALGK